MFIKQVKKIKLSEVDNNHYFFHTFRIIRYFIRTEGFPVLKSARESHVTKFNKF
jgi:hypothetical protein